MEIGRWGIWLVGAGAGIAVLGVTWAVILALRSRENRSPADASALRPFTGSFKRDLIVWILVLACGLAALSLLPWLLA